ncbi:MAG TPA: Hint domain-containing protein [Candidatus Diapherotrites archaeon]|nr:Hint domain-containing protein [Candidatus Diapherotrites archaeon]
MRTKKAISPIVSTILLVVVAVILITVALNWGKDFTNKSLETTNPILKETSKNYMVGSVKLNPQGILSFKNITPGDQPMTITGYKILSTSDDANFNTVIDIEDVTILPGTVHIISIPAFPPDKQVTIQLITDDYEYISVGSITNIPEEQQDIPEPEPEIEFYVSGTPLSPRTVANDNSVGTITWDSIDNIKSSDNLYSTATVLGHGSVITHYLKATNFGFNIPTGAIIDGIKVEIEKHGGDISALKDVYDNSVKIIKSDGTIGATEKKDSVYEWSDTDTNAYVTCGGNTDLWDETWTAEQINNANFGVAISAKISSSSGGGGQCLNEDTLILTEQGNKKIKELIIGDLVISYNDITKQLEFKPITNIWSSPISNANNRYFYIYYDNGKVIKATENHRFFVNGEYKRADELQIGDILLSSDLQEQPIENIEIVENTTDVVWDIEVEDNHNFFANDILVHNDGTAYIDHIRMTVYYTN